MCDEWVRRRCVEHRARAALVLRARARLAAFALDRPLGPAEVRGCERLLELDAALDAAAFSAGLEALLVRNLDNLTRRN